MEQRIKELIPKDKGKSAILFEDGTEVVLYKGEVRKLGLKEGMVVSEELYSCVNIKISFSQKPCTSSDEKKCQC